MNKCRTAMIIVAGLQLAVCLSVHAAGGDAERIRAKRYDALSCFARGQKEEAIKTFDDAVTMAETAFGHDSSYVADLLYDEGVVALRCDQYQKAEDCLRKAVRIEPCNKEARLKLAEYLNKRGRFAEAKSQIRRVMARDPGNLAARQLLAMSFQSENNRGRATQEFYKLQQLALGHAPASTPDRDAEDDATPSMTPVPADQSDAAAIPSVAPSVSTSTTSGLKLLRNPGLAPKPTPQPPVEKPKAVEPPVKRKVEEPRKREPKKVRAAEPKKSAPKKGEPKLAKAKAPKVEPLATIPTLDVAPVKPAKAHKASRGLVPPPPAEVPTFPGVMAPIPIPQPQPPPQPKPAAKPKLMDKPKLDPKEDKQQPAEDDDFLLDWAGKKKPK